MMDHSPHTKKKKGVQTSQINEEYPKQGYICTSAKAFNFFKWGFPKRGPSLFSFYRTKIISVTNKV
jgi:hypothetical protein